MTLDLELPRMDGLTFLRSLMRHHPMPVVIVSAYTAKGSRLAMEALEYGATDIVQKPGMAYDVSEMSAELLEKVRAAAVAKVGPAPVAAPLAKAAAATGTPPPRVALRGGAPAAQRAPGISRRPANPTLEGAPTSMLPPLTRSVSPERIIAIGSSTGGTQALQYILSRLPGNMPPILIVQHMPEGFTKAFATRLDTICDLEVKEAEHRDAVVPGRVLIAPGARHMVLRRTGTRYWVEIQDGPRVYRQKPSVEVLFQSVAKVAGKGALGTILTGMGGDGAEGMLAMRQAGAVNIAEDEKSCVVFGMPKEAIKLGGVHHVIHLHRIPEKLHELA